MKATNEYQKLILSQAVWMWEQGYRDEAKDLAADAEIEASFNTRIRQLNPDFIQKRLNEIESIKEPNIQVIEERDIWLAIQTMEPESIQELTRLKELLYSVYNQVDQEVKRLSKG